MRVRSRQAINISNQIIKYIIKSYRDGNVLLPFTEVNSLCSEVRDWSREWQKTGKIIWKSNSRVSAISSESKASRLYFKLRGRVDDFDRFNATHGSRHVYGYEITINPSKLTYSNVAKVNGKIIRKFKSNRHIAIIERATEHTYCHADINVHLHYLLIATRRINLRKMYRQVKAIAKKATHGKVNSSHSSRKPYRRVDDWSKAESYVTKQCGRFPLMMVHNQWQKFQRLTESQQISLLTKDFNDGKGVKLHHFYINSHNLIARRWHSIKVNKRYCQKHGVLVHVSKSKRSASNNQRQTVFATSLDKIVKNTKRKPSKTFSRHHYSEKEILSAYYGKGVYGWKRHPKDVAPVALF